MILIIASVAFGRRYYDPVIGIWISLDPMEQHWSGYTYGSNNPTNRIDPDGNYDESVQSKEENKVFNEALTIVKEDVYFNNAEKLISHISNGEKTLMTDFFPKGVGPKVIFMNIPNNSKGQRVNGKETNNGTIVLDNSLLENPALLGQVLLHETAHSARRTSFLGIPYRRNVNFNNNEKYKLFYNNHMGHGNRRDGQGEGYMMDLIRGVEIKKF